MLVGVRRMGPIDLAAGAPLTGWRGGRDAVRAADLLIPCGREFGNDELAEVVVDEEAIAVYSRHTMQLQGKVALVTGGNTGGGPAAAMRFAQEGRRVVTSPKHVLAQKE